LRQRQRVVRCRYGSSPPSAPTHSKVALLSQFVQVHKGFGINPFLLARNLLKAHAEQVLQTRDVMANFNILYFESRQRSS
jgi:hypothetical protein